MHSHKLTLEKDRKKAEWTLEWDESYFRLKGPGWSDRSRNPGRAGSPSNRSAKPLQPPAGKLGNTKAVRSYSSGKKPPSPICGRLIQAGLRSDPEYRQQIRKRSRQLAKRGLKMFLGGGIPFAALRVVGVLGARSASGMYCFGGRRPVHPFRFAALVGILRRRHWYLWFGIAQQMRIRRIEKDLSSTGTKERTKNMKLLASKLSCLSATASGLITLYEQALHEEPDCALTRDLLTIKCVTHLSFLPG